MKIYAWLGGHVRGMATQNASLANKHNLNVIEANFQKVNLENIWERISTNALTAQ